MGFGLLNDSQRGPNQERACHGKGLPCTKTPHMKERSGRCIRGFPSAQGVAQPVGKEGKPPAAAPMLSAPRRPSPVRRVRLGGPPCAAVGVRRGVRYGPISKPAPRFAPGFRRTPRHEPEAMSPAAQGYMGVPRASGRVGLESDVRPRVPLRSTPGLPEVHLARRASCAAPCGSRLRRDAPRYPARPPLSRAARRLGRSPAQDFVGFQALQGPIHRPGHPRQGHAREKRPGMPLATSVASEAHDPPQLSGATFVPSLSPGLSPPWKARG
jgi:hypothetical protein